MIALSENENEHKNNFEKIKNQVESIKMILRCGIWLFFCNFEFHFTDQFSYASNDVWSRNELDCKLGYFIETVCYCSLF